MAVKYIIEFDLEKYIPDLFEKLTNDKLGFKIYVYDTLNNSMTILNENFSEKILPFDRGDGTIKYHAVYNDTKLPVDDIINRLEKIDKDLSYTIRKQVF